MQPYGFNPGDWRSEDWGPASKYAELSSNKRSGYRRLMHKNARNKSKREITRELDNYRREK